MFDRSWYNRAGVERVMGFCTDDQYQGSLRQAPAFEQVLTDDGIDVVKFWFSVSRTEQLTRFADPSGGSGAAMEAIPDGPGLAG